MTISTGLDMEEVVRLIMQELQNLGYWSAADALASESGIAVEADPVIRLRAAVVEGDWSEAEKKAFSILGDPDSRVRAKVVWTIARQKYLELIDARRLPEAITVLREELTPATVVMESCSDVNREATALETVKGLAALLVARDGGELRTRAKWLGADSRAAVLDDLQRLLPGSKMLENSRLRKLLVQAIEYQTRFSCRYHLGEDTRYSLLTNHECPDDKQKRALDFHMVADGKHKEEVWCLAISCNGARIASGSKDCRVYLWSTDGESMRQEGIIENTFDSPVRLAFSPSTDLLAVACMNGSCRIWELDRMRWMSGQLRHSQALASVAWVDDRRLITSSHDMTVCLWDVSSGALFYRWLNIRCRDLAYEPRTGTLYLLSGKNTVIGFDIASKQKVFCVSLASSAELTSLHLSGGRILLSTAVGELLLLELESQSLANRYIPPKLSEKYVVRASIGGERLVASGSTHGKVYLWSLTKGDLLKTISVFDPSSESSQQTVSDVVWHPGDSLNYSCFFTASDDGRLVMWRTPDKG